MAFKPANSNNTNQQNGEYEQRNYPVPKKGSRKARVSLIIDLGVQERDDVYEIDGKMVAEGTEGAEVRTQKPCQQVAVFADLVADTVDYGGSIGKQHYRLLLNNTFAGVLKGINFTATPPKDAKGNMIPNKPWGLHPANLLTKLAKAVEKTEVIESMDIEQLLGCAFMADVDVTEKDSGKVDKDGEAIIYRNVNYKGAAKVPETEDDDGNSAPLPVADLKAKPLCITFDDAKKEDIQFIRGNILKIIKLANNYAGSKIQKAIEAYEADRSNNQASEKEDEQEEEVAKPVSTAKVSKPAKKVAPVADEDDSAPF